MRDSGARRVRCRPSAQSWPRAAPARRCQPPAGPCIAPTPARCAADGEWFRRTRRYSAGCALRSGIAECGQALVNVLVGEGRAVATFAARLEQLAVHVHQALGAGALVQAVDILRAQKKAFAQLALKPASARCAGFGLTVQASLAPHGVEIPNQLGISLPGLRRSDVFHAMAVPEPAGAAEGRQPAFRADARAGEHKQPIIAANLNRRRLLLVPPFSSPHSPYFHQPPSPDSGVGNVIFIIEVVNHVTSGGRKLTPSASNVVDRSIIVCGEMQYAITKAADDRRRLRRGLRGNGPVPGAADGRTHGGRGLS